MRPPCAASSSSPQCLCWSGKLGSNQRPLDYRSSAQPTELFPDDPLSAWSPAPESNWLPRFTGAAHRPQCLQGPNLEPAERIERTSVAYRATALPLSYTGWSRRADSNRHLSFTKARFSQLNYFDLERVTGFEPVSGPWRGPILAARRCPLKASVAKYIMSEIRYRIWGRPLPIGRGSD